MYKIRIILLATKNSIIKLFNSLVRFLIKVYIFLRNIFKNIKLFFKNFKYYTKEKQLLFKKMLLAFLCIVLVFIIYLLVYQKTHMTFSEKVQNKAPTQLMCYYENDIYEFTFKKGKIIKLVVNEKSIKYDSYNNYLKKSGDNTTSMVDLVNILTNRGYTCF